MTGADLPGGGGSSTLEKDLKTLERLLKEDSANGSGDAGDAAAVVAETGSTVKQHVRDVLRKLMEAYFAPNAVHKRETRSLLGLLKVALQRHAEVFTGSAPFCARAFAHLLPLVTCAGLSDNVRETISWCLCQLVTVSHNAVGDDCVSFRELVVGVSLLAEDCGFLLRSFQEAQEFVWQGGHHVGHGYGAVVLGFHDSMAALAFGEKGNATTSGLGKHHANRNSAVLAVEVSGPNAAAALALVACRLVAHALRVSPQASCCFLTPKTVTACSEISSNPNVGCETRRAALSAIRSILAECPSGVFSPDAVLAHLAVTMRERAGGAARATPPEGRKRDAFDAELAACVNASVDAATCAECDDACGDDEHGNATAHGRGRGGALEQLVVAAVATVEAGVGGVSPALRAAALRTARACCLAKPSTAAALTPLFAHAGSSDVADALVECVGRAFTFGKDTPDLFVDKNQKRGDTADEAGVSKRRRLSLGAGPTGPGAGVSNDERLGTTEDGKDGRLASSSGRAGSADDATLAWIENCVVSALSQLGPSTLVGAGGTLVGDGTETDPSLAAPARAKASAGLARVAAALRRPHPRLAAAAATRDWMKWARRAHDSGDGAVAGAYAAVLRAADALSRRVSDEILTDDTDGDDRNADGLGDEDLGTEGLLLWPWSVGADESPAEFKREAKIAALRTALAAVASRAEPSTTAKTAMKRTLQAGFHDGDDAVRAAAACAAPASHLLLGLAGGALDARTPLGVIASVAEARGTSAHVRAAVATAVGGLAAAGAALGARAGGSGRGAAANDAILRALARDSGQRCVSAAASCNAGALAAAATAFDIAVTDAMDRAEARANERAASRATAGTSGRSRATANANAARSATLPVQDAARLLTTMLSLTENADVAAAALAATPRVLRHATRGGAAGEALVGAAALSSAATPLARHDSAHVRYALLVAAPALASRGALLDAAFQDGDAMEMDGRGVGGDDARERSVKDAGLSLLQRLKSNVEDASDAATRETALRVFAAAAAAMPHADCLDAALISMVHRLDDPDPGVRAAAVELVRAAATRKGLRPRELLLGNKLVAGHLGVKLPNAPGVLAVLAEALLRVPERQVLVELLPAAVPRLVERRDVETLKLYAQRLGAEYDVATILHDWCYTAIADLINNSGVRSAQEVTDSMTFLTTHTGEALEVLVADHKKELMRALIRSAGADDAANPHDEAQRLGDVLGTLAKLAADGTAVAGNGAPDSHSPEVHDFLRPHFTWLVMGDASDRSGDAAARRRFLRSLTIMVHLIGPHLPQFAPKVMAHLTSALERPSARLRKDALAAWLVVVKQLAKHAPVHLRAVAGRVVVAMLPHLPDGSADNLVGRPGSGFDKPRGASVSAMQHALREVLLNDDDDPANPNAALDNAAAAAEVIDELVLRSGKEIMCGLLARLPTLPNCDRLALANAAVREERGEIPLVSLLQTLTDGLEDESQAVRATALGELRRALRVDPAEVSKLLNGTHDDPSSGLLTKRVSTGTQHGNAPSHRDSAADVVGRLVAALLRCCVSENRTALSLRVQRLAAVCLGELGAVDPGRIDLPIALSEKLSGAASGVKLANKLLCEHIARTVRGAVDVDMLDAAAIAAQEILVHVECRPASVRAEDFSVVGTDDSETTTKDAHRSSQDKPARLPEGASKTGEAFWEGLPEEIRALLAPGLTSMYCLTREPAKPPTARPLYKAPGGPSFRRWLYSWCRALASEATGPDAPVFAVCAAGVFKHDTRVMLFLLPRMVLDALAANHDAPRVTNVLAEIIAVLRDAAGNTSESSPSVVVPPFGTHVSEQAELAAQAVFTLLDQLAAWKEDVGNPVEVEGGKHGSGAVQTVSKNDQETISVLSGLLDAVPRELLARAALRCGAPARALLYFEDHLRSNKNVLNQSSLKHGEPEGGGLDDQSASFLAATHRALAEPDALEAVARLRSRRALTGGLAGSDALAAARRRAEDALLQHEQAGEWTEAMTHYESASRRGEGESLGANALSQDSKQLDPAERGRLRCLQGLGHLRALEKEAETLIASRPDSRAELADMGAAAAWRLGEWDSLENFLDVLDKSGAPVDGGAAGVGGDFAGRPGGEAAVGRVLLALHRRDADGVARAATAARDAVITPLAAAAMEGSYRRAHPAVVQLHLIREAEEAMEAIVSLDSISNLAGSGLTKNTPGVKRARSGGGGARAAADGLDGHSGIERLGDWDPRLDLTPSAMATREPILALRRVAYAALGTAAEDASAYTWLAQAKLCRASGHAGAAQLALFEARAALESASFRRGAGAAADGILQSTDFPGAKLKASPAPGMALAVEQAKLLWCTGRQHRATVEIQEALDDSALRGADPLTTSRAMLRLARWSAATGQRSKTDVLNIYSNVLRDQRHTEKANFHVAKYMDDLLKDAKVREDRKRGDPMNKDDAKSNGGGAQRPRGSKTWDVDERSLDYVVEVIQHYATSLRHGHRHAYESLPRMLTLWFDVGAAAAMHAETPTSTAQNGNGSRLQTGAQRTQNQPQLTSTQLKERKVALTATNSLKDFSQKLPLYTWLPALPQLTSRLCHPHHETRQLIHELLYRLVKNFPNQVLWSMTAMARSTHVDRSSAAQRILDRAKDGAPTSARPLFEQSAALCDQLIRVCAFQPKPVPGSSRSAKFFSIKTEFPALRRLVPCDVMVPTQNELTPSLPPSTFRNAANANHVPTVSEWNAFPNETPTIFSIQDECPVLASLQKPKKLTIVDSDGAEKSFLCKPKDDLRKDLRMMEFCQMLNRLLGNDPRSRKRHLRTFAVIPLTEDCGLIEWVPSTTGLRHVVQKLYVDDGVYHKRTLVEVKEMHERLKATPTTWMSEILKKFPPVFHRWFLNRWKDRPAAWHGTRTAFAHTAAVWSMVGHVVGLGDRHGENILLDQESGDCVHVDFSCLFDKGLELETPEMVPFRCTQNIVDGLGAGGYEGVFMRASEITLGVLRNHREALMSVLETFVHDPLVEWSKAVKAGGGSGRRPGGDGQGANFGAEAERGKEALDKITSRLEGVVVGVGSAPSLPLSPQGQARRLIEEATSRKSLGAMYVWWMAWM